MSCFPEVTDQADATDIKKSGGEHMSKDVCCQSLKISWSVLKLRLCNETSLTHSSNCLYDLTFDFLLRFLPLVSYMYVVIFTTSFYYI